MIKCVPVLKDEIEKVADPVGSSATETDRTPLSEKTTFPVGTPDVAGTTVAVKVTDWPPLEGFGDELMDVLVEAMVTVCEI